LRSWQENNYKLNKGSSIGDDISGLYMLLYSDARARFSFSKSVTYTVGNKTENIGCRYGSSRSGSGSKHDATHLPSSAERPRRAAQDAHGKMRELLAARSLKARTFV